ncbi:DUF6443 domain-containing protein [Flavobacterium sp. B183]|uniref:DUF6443 domain-containing protein n=1 Tax=Flavobacterium sp. B183 TaxID=907046 RepID=UPI00201ECE2A|nr:DUF6443 domain-containing protein [Flavobacterium sp. B183]URC11675.1 DUF6443 domain-containing protein [Flavobacterium sp. B183]
MKKYITLVILLFFTVTGARAQTFSDDNFIYTLAPKKPVQTAGLNALTKDEKKQNITYFDGLGRPVQTIAIGQGEGGKDIITPVEYDVFGRQVKEYLPYASQNGGDNYARIDPATAINALTGFYGTQTYDNTANPFSLKKLEASPLNRVLRQAAPGNSWAMDSGHEIKMDYQTNIADEVRLFTATTTWDAGLGLFKTVFSDEGNYAANQLYKTITYDENTAANPSESSGSTVEFKNKEGQVILKRTYNSGDKHDTYYVYDRYGNLSYVLPPKVQGVVSVDVLNGLCYQYKYDHRNRLVEKKLPGKQWEYIVYDKLDRPVATGPAFSPFKDETTEGWLITKYDGLGRPVYTGWSSTPPGSANRKTLQDQQNSAAVLFETRGSEGTIDDNIVIYYSNSIAPINFKLLTVTYYDDYAFPNAVVKPATIEDQPVLDNIKGLVTGIWTRALTTASETLGETTTTFYDSKARAISTRIQNHLGGYTNMDSKLDFIGKSLYTVTKHKRASGDAELTIKEEFTYSPQDRLLTHTHQINGGTVEVLANNTYDDLGQLSAKDVGNSAANPLQKVQYTYNIRGWLTEINNIKNLQQDTDPLDLFAFNINYDKQPGNSQVQALYNGNISETYWKTGTDLAKRSYGYQYDNLNRLTSAIYSKPNDAIPVSGAYNESLSYDKNGNIKSLQRYGASDAPTIVFQIDDLTYGYLDQNSNQLTKVTDGPAGNDNKGFKDANKTGDDFTYDLNGNMIADKNKNITTIQYNQLNLPKKIVFGTTGSIEYIYNATGQKVEKIVKETSGITHTDYLTGFQYKYSESQGDQGGGNEGEGDPPAPDDPGNTDPPIDGYDPVPKDPPAEASRFSAFAAQSVSQAVPSRPTLQFFPTAEGYYDDIYKKYVYQYKDHLGNVRVSYAKNPATQVLEIIEENNYYPFGLKHTGYNDYVASSNKYKYNGKELQDELGLNMYDYGWRNYDSALGRWVNIDNMAEKFISLSPYHYAGNNPVLYLDVDGNEFTESAWKWVNKLIKDINSRQEKNNSDITDYKAKIAAGGSDRQIARWNKNINSLTANNAELETTRGETATLAASNQVYDVVSNSGNTQQDGLGNSTTVNQTTFNSDNNRVQLTVSSGTDLGLFSHELKHMYQFETGETSLGLTKNNGAVNLKGNNLLFYDLSDEVQAYQRGALFGQRENVNSVSDILERGVYSDKIPSGPINAINYPNAAGIKQDPQSIANKYNAAFRIGTTTYKPQ